MNSEDTPSAFDQDLEITTGLEAVQLAEAQALAWDGEVGSAVRGELQKHPSVGTSLVELSGGVQEPRPVAERGRYPLPISPGASAP